MTVVPSRGWVWVAPVVALLLYMGFGYTVTLSEPDLVRMATGLVYGQATGEHLAAGQHYGAAFSFGYYDLMYGLMPTNTRLDPDAVARSMNTAGAAFAVLFALALALMLSRLVGDVAAPFATFAFMASPAMLQFIVSAHPMVGAAAFLFFGCWLVLLACDPGVRRASWPLFAAAALLFFVGLCLRGEVALAFPFVVGMTWFELHRKPPQRPWWPRVLAACVALLIAFAGFWTWQRPYVDTGGGAVETLARFIAEFTSIGRVAQGVAVFVLSLGVATAVGCVVTAWARRGAFKPNGALLAICAVLIVPSLAFWLTNPRPARHFLFPMLGVYTMLGALWTTRLFDIKRAMIAAVVLIAANQLLSELVRPVIVKRYPWSFDAGNRRRAVQQAPLGFFPFDQRANFAGEEVFREEAMAVAATDPTQLLFVGDTPFYLASWLIYRHPSYHFSETSLGRLDAYLLEDGDRKIYFIDKYHHWPDDILPELLARPDVAGFKVYVQPATVSRYDKTTVPPERAYHVD